MVLITLLAILSVGASACPPGLYSWSASPLCKSYCPTLSWPDPATAHCQPSSQGLFPLLRLAQAASTPSSIAITLDSLESAEFPYSLPNLALAPSHRVEIWARFDEVMGGCMLRKGQLALCVGENSEVELRIDSGNLLIGGKVRKGETMHFEYEMRAHEQGTTIELWVDEESVGQTTLQGVFFEDDIANILVLGEEFLGVIIEASLLPISPSPRLLLTCPSTCTRCTREGVCILSCPLNQYWDPSGLCLPCLSTCVSGCLRGTDCVLRSDMLSTGVANGCVDYAVRKGGKCQCADGAALDLTNGVPTCTCVGEYKADTTTKTCGVKGYYYAQGAVTGTFSADYKQAIFTFSPAAEAAVTVCGDAFVGETAAKLGDTPTCAWSTDLKKLTVTFGVGATLLDTDLSIFNATNIHSSHTTGQTQTTARINISTKLTFPTPAKLPTAVIIAPEEYSIICGDLVLSGERSSGNYGRELKYAWSLVASPALPLLSTIATGKTTQAVVSIPQTWLRPGTVTVSLTVTTFFGTSNTATVTVTISGGNVLPLIIEGGDSLVSFKTREVKVKAAVRKECAAGRNLRYQWLFNSALPYAPVLDYKSILETQSQSQYLLIPPGSLLANFTYWFTAYVYDKADESITGSKRFQLKMPWDDLVIVFDKAAGGVFYQGSPLEINAINSYDPDNQTEVINYSWRCAITETGKPCYSALIATELLIPTTSTTSQISIPSAKMTGNGNYTITLNVTKAFPWTVNYPYRTNERTLIMRAQNTSRPVIKMLTYPARPIGARSIPIFESFVDSKENITYAWSQSSGPAINPIIPGSYNYFLVRDWLPGNTYVLTVSANLNQTAAVTINVNVEVSKAPEGGTFVATPSTVLATTDLVSLQAHNWIDAEVNYPLTYEYRYLTASTWRIIRPASTVVDLEARLPASATSVQVVICDNLGSCTSLTRAVTVLPQNLTLNIDSSFQYEILDFELTPGLISLYSDSVPISATTATTFFTTLEKYHTGLYRKSESAVDIALSAVSAIMASRPAGNAADRLRLFKFLMMVARSSEDRLTDGQITVMHTLASTATNINTLNNNTGIRATYQEIDDLLICISQSRGRHQLPHENPLLISTTAIQGYYARQSANLLPLTVVSLASAQVTFPVDMFSKIKELDANAVVDLVVSSYPSYSGLDLVYSDIVSFRFEHVGSFASRVVTLLPSPIVLSLTSLPTPISLRIPRSTPSYVSTNAHFLAAYQCVSLTSLLKWSTAGCTIIGMTTTYVDVASVHSSIFAVQDKAVTEVVTDPVPMADSPGILVPCDHCGTILTPIWFNIVIFCLAIVLAAYGVAKDKVDVKKNGDYDFSVLRTMAEQEKLDEQLRNRPIVPWYHTFWEGHLLFGSFWYHRPDISRWARFLIIGVSLISEECILGVLYWKVKDKPDTMCDRAIYDIYHSMGPTDAFLIFVTVITWTPFTILLVLLFNHLKTFANTTLYSLRVIIACVLLFIFVGLGTAGVVEVSIEMCGSTSVAWTFSFIYLMIGEVAVTHSAIALVRTFLVKCSQTAWREPVN